MNSQSPPATPSGPAAQPNDKTAIYVRRFNMTADDLWAWDCPGQGDACGTAAAFTGRQAAIKDALAHNARFHAGARLVWAAGGDAKGAA